LIRSIISIDAVSELSLCAFRAPFTERAFGQRAGVGFRWSGLLSWALRPSSGRRRASMAMLPWPGGRHKSVRRWAGGAGDGMRCTRRRGASTSASSTLPPVCEGGFGGCRELRRCWLPRVKRRVRLAAGAAAGAPSTMPGFSRRSPLSIRRLPAPAPGCEQLQVGAGWCFARLWPECTAKVRPLAQAYFQLLSKPPLAGTRWVLDGAWWFTWSTISVAKPA
jgi:hypothetical protein